METIEGVVASLMQAWKEKNKKYQKGGPSVTLKKILTTKEQKHAKVAYLKKGVVGISVDTSSWLYYFSLQKNELLVKLCRQFPEIKDIRFCIGDTK